MTSNAVLVPTVKDISQQKESKECIMSDLDGCFEMKYISYREDD